MKISVVMCTRDRPEMVRMSIESILAVRYDDFDVHVVDQSTGCQTRDVVAELAPRLGTARVHWHYQEVPGLARARNCGVSVSDGDIVAFVDDDVIVPVDWLDTLVRAFTSDENVDLVYGQVCVPKSLKEAQRDGMIVPSLVWTRREKIGAPGRFRLWGMGANMAARRTLIERLGGFDETLGVGGVCRAGEDFDFSYRTYSLGSAILLEPELHVDHYGMRSAEQWPVTLKNYGFGDGAFFMKHLRCRDLRIVGVLFRHAGLVAARTLKSSLRSRRWVRSAYLESLLRGMRFSFKMTIDPHRKYVYVGEIASTEANPITIAR